jgi:hypothetical protein
MAHLKYFNAKQIVKSEVNIFQSEEEVNKNFKQNHLFRTQFSFVSVHFYGHGILICLLLWMLFYFNEKHLSVFINMYT